MATLQATVRTALAQIAALVPSKVVTVVSNGQTTTGLRAAQPYNMSLTLEGEQGKETSAVRVDASTLTQPEIGTTIIVAGEKATVTEARPDDLGANIFIAYTVQKPVTLEDLT
jgi:hypothetical protein